MPCHEGLGTPCIDHAQSGPKKAFAASGRTLVASVSRTFSKGNEVRNQLLGCWAASLLAAACVSGSPDVPDAAGDTVADGTTAEVTTDAVADVVADSTPSDAVLDTNGATDADVQPDASPDAQVETSDGDAQVAETEAGDGGPTCTSDTCVATDPCEVAECVDGACVIGPKDCDDSNVCTNDFCLDGTCYSEPRPHWWKQSTLGYGFPVIVNHGKDGATYSVVPTWPQPIAFALQIINPVGAAANVVPLPTPLYYGRPIGIYERSNGDIAVARFGKTSLGNPHYDFRVDVYDGVTPPTGNLGAFTDPNFIPQTHAQFGAFVAVGGTDTSDPTPDRPRLRFVGLDAQSVGVSPAVWDDQTPTFLSAVGRADGHWLLVDSKGEDITVYRVEESDGTKTTTSFPAPQGFVGVIKAVVAVPDGGVVMGGYVREPDDVSNPALTAQPWVVRLNASHTYLTGHVGSGTPGSQITSGAVRPGVEPTFAWAGFSLTNADPVVRDGMLMLTDAFARVKLHTAIAEVGDVRFESIVAHPEEGWLIAGTTGEGDGGVLDVRRLGVWGSAECTPSDACDAADACPGDGEVCTLESCANGQCSTEQLISPQTCHDEGYVCTAGTCPQ